MDDKNENEIVRHEALSAYSSISSSTKLMYIYNKIRKRINEYLFSEKYLNDESRVIKESAIVCVEMINYWTGDRIC